MNRRGFLKSIFGAVAAVVAVPVLKLFPKTANPAQLARKHGEIAAEMEFWEARRRAANPGVNYRVAYKELGIERGVRFTTVSWQMSRLDKVEDIEQALTDLWRNHSVRPRWIANGGHGREWAIRHGIAKPEDFTEVNGVFYLGTPPAEAYDV